MLNMIDCCGMLKNLYFRPADRGSRKVVVATNIAETSITIGRTSVVVQNAYGGTVPKYFTEAECSVRTLNAKCCVYCENMDVYSWHKGEKKKVVKNMKPCPGHRGSRKFPVSGTPVSRFFLLFTVFFQTSGHCLQP